MAVKGLDIEFACACVVIAEFIHLVWILKAVLGARVKSFIVMKIVMKY